MLVTRLLRLLTIFALLFSSISMMSGHAAMAFPGSPAPIMDHVQQAAMTGHCADMDMNKNQKTPRSPNIDCMIACAAIPAVGNGMTEMLVVAEPSPPWPIITFTHGLQPESDPPPPRFS